MATKDAPIAPPGKEKRGTSPSNVSAATRGRSPNPPKKPSSPARAHPSPKKPASPARAHPSPKKPASPARTHNTSLTSEKPVPNYLKPTISTSSDFSKLLSKKPASKTDENPTLFRRRSFDRPPSIERSQKSRVSPSPTLRSSSSFSSGKITSPQRGVPDRNLRTPKEAGKQRTLYARPVNTAKKSSTISIKKRETGDNSSKAKEKSVASPHEVDGVSAPNVLEPETESEEQETLHNGDDNEKGDEDSSLENQESISNEKDGGAENYAKIVNHAIAESICNEQATEDKDGETTTSEASTVLEHQKPITIEQAEGESENKDAKSEATIGSSTINSEGIKDSLLEDQEPIIIIHTEGDSEDTDTEIVSSELPGKSEHQNDKNTTIAESLEGPENHNTSLGVNTEEAEDAKQEESNEEDNINETNNAINSDTKQEESNDEDSIHETNNAINSDGSVSGNISEEVEVEEEMGSSKEGEPSGGDGTRETKENDVQQVVVEKEQEPPEVQIAHGNNDIPVSNDVIEETGSKLREQRQNKVRALAGAFESVISMQEK